MTLTDTSPKFAFQGVPGAFSHSAGQLFARTLGYEGKAAFTPCNTFVEMFERVVGGYCQFGVVPLENSSIGSITANYDLLWASDVTIIGEVSMPIHHHLIGLEGTDIAKLSEIYSHPAALDQCRNLFKELAGVRPVAHFDTSGAARYVREKNDFALAALAGEAAADEHGLVVLKANVEDYPENTTRFGIISKLDHNPDSPKELPKPPYKISCAVELPHQPGSLAKLLTRLAGLELNLTKIESRPIPQAAWHYRFFVDIELDGQDQDASVVRVLKDSSESYRLLGRYRPWTL
jgi:prephenate dehydratase